MPTSNSTPRSGCHHGGLLAGAERQAVGRLVRGGHRTSWHSTAPGGVPPREARRHIRGMAENPHRRQLRRHTRHPLPHGRHRPGGGRRENIPCQCHGEAPCHHRRLGKRGFVVSNLAGTEKVIFGSLCSADVQRVCLCRLGRQRVAAWAITLPSARVSCVTKPRHSARRQLRLPMLDGALRQRGGRQDGRRPRRGRCTPRAATSSTATTSCG